MAPEILRYEKYDAKADLWSVGAVLFEMCVGKPPFRAQNHVDLLRKIERGEDRIKFPDEKRSSTTATTGGEGVGTRTGEAAAAGGVEKVAQDLKALIRRLLKRNPTERMSFEEFFLEAKWVAEGGSAEGLVSAEMISRRYNAERERIAGGGVAASGSRKGKRGAEGRGGGEEAAFVKSPSSSTSLGRSSPRLVSPSPPLIPTPPPIHNPYAGNEADEQPPFARQSSNRASPSPTPSSIRRTPSFAPKYVVGRSSSPAALPATVTTAGAGGEVRSRDFALSGGRAAAGAVTSGELRGGEKEELDDSEILGRDYVVVEKRTVEINALADGQSSSSPRYKGRWLIQNAGQNWRTHQNEKRR